MNWYEKEEMELGRALDAGEITEAEYRKYSRELFEELQQSAQDAADEAYDSVFG